MSSNRNHLVQSKIISIGNYNSQIPLESILFNMLPRILSPENRQRLSIFGIYVATSCILCVIADRVFISSSRISGLFYPSSVDDHADHLSAINYIKTANSIIGLTSEEAGVDTTNTLKIYHSTSSMCFEKPTDFTIPNLGLKQTTQAIIIPGAGCSPEEKARNIVSWYQEENKDIKVVFIYDYPALSIVEPFHTSSNKLTKANQIPLCVLSVTHHLSAMALIKESAKVRDHSFSVKFPADNVLELPPKLKFQVVIYEFMTSIVITIMSFVITAGILFWRWGESFTIEFNREGVLISYSGENDDHIDPDVLLSKEQVLKLPEIQFNATMDEECSPDAALIQNLCTSITCPVCIDDFEKDELVRVLPCGHMYHTDCIVPWLTTRAPNCPMCKASIDNSEKGGKKMLCKVISMHS